jgi:hypothetical protein
MVSGACASFCTQAHDEPQPIFQLNIAWTSLSARSLNPHRAAVHLPDTSYEDVAFITDRYALVRGADVVLDIMFGSDTSSCASTWIREDCL